MGSIASAAATPAFADGAFKPPPGFKQVKRGQFILYCNSKTPIGTRIKTTECFDEAQLRAYALALQEGKVEMDRLRNSAAATGFR